MRWPITVAIPGPPPSITVTKQLRFRQTILRNQDQKHWTNSRNTTKHPLLRGHKQNVSRNSGSWRKRTCKTAKEGDGPQWAEQTSYYEDSIRLIPPDLKKVYLENRYGWRVTLAHRMDPRQQRAVRKGGIKPLTPEALSLKSKNPKLRNPKSKVKSFWAGFWILNFAKSTGM